MSTYDVISAGDLTQALSFAAAGDVIRLAGGNYGDVKIQGLNFTAPVTIESADANNPATFNTLNITSSSGLTFQSVAVDMAAKATSATFSSVIMISKSSAITFEGDWVKAELAINGVEPDATTLDKTGDVIGLPTARAFTVDHSSNVTIDHTEITQVFHGIALVQAHDLVITNNNIHDIRTSPIAGGNVSNILISGNRLTDSHPWHWGSGDHADFIHLWTDPDSQTTPSSNIVITNNVLDQGSGANILGIYLDDNGEHIGFTGVTIQDNLILTGTGQGMRLENVANSTITGNTLLDPVGNNRHAPGILADGSAATLDVHGNIVNFVSNNPGSLATFHDNTLVQDTKATAAGYYTPDLVALTRALDTVSAFQGATQVLAGADVHSFFAGSTTAPSGFPNVVVQTTSPVTPTATPTSFFDTTMVTIDGVHVSVHMDFSMGGFVL